MAIHYRSQEETGGTMKLRNKKTGQIYNACHIAFGESIECLEKKQWKTLEEFNEDWEDVEEPEQYWFINDLDGEPIECDLKSCGKSNFVKWSERRKKIGNYFETKEEAEKAVEKLKAWKRLKDKGFRFEGIKQDYTRFFSQQKPMRTGRKYLQFNKAEDEEWMKENWEDLDLLFGGEDD